MIIKSTNQIRLLRGSTGGSFYLKPGTYTLKEIPNPYEANGKWWVISETMDGATVATWESLITSGSVEIIKE